MLKPTGRLRFVKRVESVSGRQSITRNVLQQEFSIVGSDEGGDGEMYEFDTGETEWEDVPLVEEE